MNPTDTKLPAAASEPTTAAAPAATTETSEANKPVDKHTEIQREIKTRIGKSTPEVIEMYVAGEVEEEKRKRASLIKTGTEQLTQTQRDLDKAKPDDKKIEVGTDGKGKEVLTYTTAKWEERQKLEKKIEQLRKALDAAYTGDFKALKETVGKS